MKESRGPCPGWGNLPCGDAQIFHPSHADQVAGILPGQALGVRGLGRSYGDAASAPRLLNATTLRGDFALDQDKGLLRVGAGRSLGEVTALTLPWGWAPAVLPGTRHVTVGGAVAADVHGKNHHVDGAFCRHVVGLRVLLADGSAVDCSPSVEAELFGAVCGGMGLCGLVLEATLQLAPRRSSLFRRRTLPCAGLEQALDVLRGSSATHTVAWVDAATPGKALGRSLVHLGDPDDGDGPLDPATEAWMGLPFLLPFNLVRPPLMRAFNQLVWTAGKGHRGQEGHQAYSDFFWPLDAVQHWNRLYGRQGFLQFQCLLPEGVLAQRGAEPFMELLRLFLKAGGGSLAVLKTMGPRNEATAPIAFPGPGATLALDLPASPAGRETLRRANHLVADWGGRVYLAKDALLDAATFARMTPGLGAWRALRERWDPGRRWQTDMSKRLEL